MKIRQALILAVSLAATASCLGQTSINIPTEDIRNVRTTDVRTPMPLPHFEQLSTWEAHKQALRLQVLSAAGLYPMPKKTPLQPQIFGRIDGDGYTIEKVLIATMPGYYLGGNLYRPKDKQGRHPAILNPHGHWQYGRLENQPLYSGEAFGVTLAKLGFVVFAYDMVGYTDTVQTLHDFATPETRLWSFTPLGLQLWNSTRGLDFLASLDDVDASKIGMAGASGGGTQTFLLTAIDDRIQFAAPVNMVSSIMQGNDACENAPGLRIGTNNVEIAAMFAPKPMLLVSATGDWTTNVPRVEFPAIQSIYLLYGKASDVEVVQIDAKHNFNQQSREAVYRFFAKRVLHRTDAESITEPPMKGHKLQEMMATSARPLPSDALDFQGVFRQWKTLGTQALQASDNATQRTALRLALHTEVPQHVLSSKDGDAILMGRPGVGDRVRGILVKGKGKPVIIVDPAGAHAGMQGQTAKTLQKAHRPVLFLDVFQTGQAIAPRNRMPVHFATYNFTDDQSRIQDIVTAATYLKQNASAPIEVYGIGKAAVWSTLAATTTPNVVSQSVDAQDLKLPDAKLAEAFQLPGLQRAGGIDAALRLANPTAR